MHERRAVVAVVESVPAWRGLATLDVPHDRELRSWFISGTHPTNFVIAVSL